MPDTNYCLTQHIKVSSSEIYASGKVIPEKSLCITAHDGVGKSLILVWKEMSWESRAILPAFCEKDQKEVPRIQPQLSPFPYSKENADSARTHCALNLCQTLHTHYKKDSKNHGSVLVAGFSALGLLFGGREDLCLSSTPSFIFQLLKSNKMVLKKNPSNFCFPHFCCCLALPSISGISASSLSACAPRSFSPNLIHRDLLSTPLPGPHKPKLTFTISWVFPELIQQAGSPGSLTLKMI